MGENMARRMLTERSMEKECERTGGAFVGICLSCGKEWTRAEYAERATKLQQNAIRDKHWRTF